GGRGADAFEGGVFVAVGGFAKGTILLLDGEEPVGGFDDVIAGHVFVDGFQACEDLPGAVDEVDAPSAPPAAGRILLGFDKSDGAPDGGIFCCETAMAEAFQDSAGD